MTCPRNAKLLAAGAFTLSILALSPAADAETLRLLTWGNYAPEKVIELFEEKYPDITVEVTVSNNEEMIAKLRATGGAGYDLAQPGFNRVAAAQEEFDIYKPLDLSKIDTSVYDPILLDRVTADTTINGEVYAVPHQWGTSGIMVDISKAPDAKDWTDLCNEEYKGRTSMRLRRSVLIGTAFAMGKNPYATYSDLDAYKALLDEVSDHLIACKPNVKAYWTGGDDLASLMLSGEVVVAETWDSTAFRLAGENPNIVFVPPASGALGWIDSFALPRKGKADEAAYKWINFVLQPEIVTMMAASSGAITAVKDGVALMPDEQRAAVERAYDAQDIANIKWAARILPGVEDLEGKALERIKAATGG